MKQIFETYIETGSLSAAYREVKKKGLLTRKQKVFTKASVYHILRNIIYAGKIKHRDEIYDGLHEPIISEKIFDLAQSLHKEKVKKYKLYRHHIFGGLTICDECERYMTPSFINKHIKKKLKRYFYYRCTSTFKKEWKSCSIRQVNADKLKIPL